MSFKIKIASTLTAVCVLATSTLAIANNVNPTVDAATAITTDEMEWGLTKISGGGFVSGIVTGQKAMYARTDVGGAYRYDYEQKKWIQLMEFVTDADRGFLSVDAMCVDPTDDDTIYLLAGCAYFSSERTAIFKSTDGGETFTEHDVTDLIKVHGNGYGRQCGEAIAVDPENPNIIYCGGDTDGLIMSTDAGKTWSFVESFDELGLFTNEIKWPTWTDTIEKTTVGTDYGNCNGIGTVAIANGKVYVGVSDNTLSANLYVADVGKDNWKPLSADLPANSFPSRINKDADGNLLISYVGGLAFNGTGGGIYKYDIANDKVTDISPTGNSFGACVSLPDDANTLIATTCGVWSTNSWSETDSAYGDWLYRSTDGGQTWDSIYPGKMGEWYYDEDAQEMRQAQLIDYLDDNGCSWIYGKAIHWSGAIVLNPLDPEKALVTSGNGIFEWDGIWNVNPKSSFHADGIEEVVVLDMVSVPGGDAYSAIGDYDGFIHKSVYESGIQHKPNMGSTGAIAYCPQNPDVMIRIAENNNDIAPGFYTLDGGETWTKMANSPGGKAAITQLDDDTYRFFKGNKDDGNVSYSDDFGATWTACTGISSTYGSKPTYMFVEPEKPNVVYAYATYYNSSWFYSKPAPDFEDAHYTLYVSTDYGKTFTGTDIAEYDQCDSAARIASLGEDNLILAAGWNGLYNVTDGGKTVTDLDVFYCKTVGYGAPERAGDVNTLFMYGMPEEGDAEGIYRSQDGGKTWVAINLNKLYGGTGNGNFLVGDMNEYGKVYMSTVGMGIVYGKLTGDIIDPTTEPSTKDPDGGIIWGDANCDGIVTVADVVASAAVAADPNNFSLSAQGLINADVHNNGDGISATDASIIQEISLDLYKGKKLPVS